MKEKVRVKQVKRTHGQDVHINFCGKTRIVSNAKVDKIKVILEAQGYLIELTE